MTYKESIKGGLNYFWKYLGLSIVLIIFLFLLFLLLIIPGIIFLIYWLFAPYVLIAENKKIMESLKRSKEIVKGRWWHVFGYFLLFSIILGIILFILTIPNFFLSSGILKLIINQVYTLISVPLSLLFFRNFYYDLIKNK